MNAIGEDVLASACDTSLERSRHRRAIARRLRTRRRRSRGGSGAVAGLLAAATVVAPFALAQGGGSSTQGRPGAAAILKQGSSGAVVTKVQRALGVSPTGYYGSKTHGAVRRFQRAHALVVDGIAGPQTLGALGIAAPAAAPAPATAKGSQSAAATGPLARIAQCESGGDPTAVSRTGRYRGKYQFSRATWHAMGGQGDPAAAPEAEQDRIAAKLYSQQGSAPWPNCG